MKRMMVSLMVLGGSAGAFQAAQPATPTQSSAKTPLVRVSLTQDQIKTTTVNGKAVETVIPSPKSVLPDDVLREEVTAVNVSGKLVKNPTISVPVPKGTTFVGSATAGNDRWNTQYSIDNGKTYAASPQKSVTTTENGKSVTKQVAALPSEYTNVRWAIGTLMIDETLKFSFLVKVN
ncbi:hypothetical protein MF271_13460 [Deinococcus sp. KNUC1210]|uniref:hypothetical protein n=1 Tax=Deinococcus sp. KNUC1210 TaxID=2917691 RepID=UPI001EEFC81E|nr:hypothetical protein [Deinococcus sp. KNUC1210]ULH14964.1 hypothetical protein MF271_13460 [Deinococcus sp. KNUC1210]